MAILTYAALAGAIVTLLLLPTVPRWGLPALVLLFPFLNHTIPRMGAGLNAETLLYSVALVVVLFRGRPTLPPPRYVLPIAAYFLVMLFSLAILATWYDPGRNYGAELYNFILPLKSQLWPTLGLFVFFALAPDETLRRRLLFCLAVALLVGAGSSLLTPGYNTSIDGTRLVGILYRNPNEFGGFLGVFGVVPLVAFFRSGAKTPERIFAAVVYAVVLVGLVLSRSRGSWLAFMVGHAIWLLYVNRWLLPPAIVAGFFLVTTAYSLQMLPETIQERIEETLTPGQAMFRQGGSLEGRLDQSASIRFVLYQMSGDMLMDSPIWGHGYRGFSQKDSQYGAPYGVFRAQHKRTGGTAAESLYARVAAEQGLIGLAVLGWLAFVLIEAGHRLTRLRGSERDIGILMVSVIGAAAAGCLTQGLMLVHEVSVPFWMICGIGIHALRDELALRRAVPQPEPEPLPEFAPTDGGLQPTR